jgi:tripartite-type tricarboxylate transporter receptor subunit TctC
MKKLLGAILLATWAAVSTAAAQSYPSRPVTLLVPFPAGGATDVLARFLAERMRLSLGQPIVIENVAGAAGTIGVGRAVRAPADGYTMQIGTSTTNVMTGALYALQFDLMTDLEPIIQIASEPMMIVGKKDFPANNLKEMIAWLKANPDKASVGIPGVGGTGHLTGLAFQKETGTRFTFVPYRGNAPALQDLVAGQIDLQMEPASKLLRAGEGRRDQAVRDDVEKAHWRGAADSDRGRGGLAGLRRIALVWHVGAEGHADEYGDDGNAGRSDGDAQVPGARAGQANARAADAGGAARFSKS